MAVEPDQAVVELFGDEIMGRDGRVEDLVEGVAVALDPEGPAVARDVRGFLGAGRDRGGGERGRGEKGEDGQGEDTRAAGNGHGVALMISKKPQKCTFRSLLGWEQGSCHREL